MWWHTLIRHADRAQGRARARAVARAWQAPRPPWATTAAM